MGQKSMNVQIYIEGGINHKSSRLCAVDGWIGNRCGCVSSVLLLLSGQFCSVFMKGPKIIGVLYTSSLCCSDCSALERTIFGTSTNPTVKWH